MCHLTQRLVKIGRFGTDSDAMCDLFSKNAKRFNRKYERKISVSKLKNLEGLKQLIPYRNQNSEGSLIGFLIYVEVVAVH